MTHFANALSGVVAIIAAAIALSAIPVHAQESTVSADGLLTLTLTSASPSDAVGIANTYTWTVTNVSAQALNGVVLGSHWGDWCGGFNCTPPGPTLVAAPGCAGQGPDEIPLDAHFGVWCTPFTGVTLAPGQSVSGSVTLRPIAGGPPDYTVYTLHGTTTLTNLPGPVQVTFIEHRAIVAPGATDIQIKGAASNGAPPAGSTFTYTYEVKNAGPWGTFGGITFVDTLPASLSLVSAAVNAVSPLTGQVVAIDSCSVVGQTVMCPLGELQAAGGVNQQHTVMLTVAASATPQQIVNTASVLTRLPQTDSNTANNSTTVSVVTK